MPRPLHALIATVLLVVLASACATEPASEPDGKAPKQAASSAPATTVPAEPALPRSAAMVSDGDPQRALLSIPAIRLRNLPVVPYRGSPDDGPGTVIQNGGVAASPFGRRGGVGPGGVGNYIVTAHRTSSTRAFEFLPELRVGQRVFVVADEWRYVYRITGTRQTSFRSESSLARQRAAVPGHPGRTPTRAMITLSTCATPEDHAAGNWWSDAFGNPEHRIDKIGVLVARRPA
jgi:sortase A